jgi:hypothetical protein
LEVIDLVEQVAVDIRGEDETQSDIGVRVNTESGKGAAQVQHSASLYGAHRGSSLTRSGLLPATTTAEGDKPCGTSRSSQKGAP